MINQPVRDAGMGVGIFLLIIATYLIFKIVYGYIGGYMPFRFTKIYRTNNPRKYLWLFCVYLVFIAMSLTGSIVLFTFK
jgi:hypothetical protein